MYHVSSQEYKINSSIMTFIKFLTNNQISNSGNSVSLINFIISEFNSLANFKTKITASPYETSYNSLKHIEKNTNLKIDNHTKT